MTLITSQDEEDVIDFVFMDSLGEDGASGVLAARVIMTRTSLLRFREAIDRHLAKNG